MQSRKRLIALAMTLVFPLLMSTGSYVEAQGSKARAEAKEAARDKKIASMETLKAKIKARTEAEQAARAQNAPSWKRELDQEQVNYFGLQVRNAIGVTMGDLLTKRTNPTSSIRSTGEDCVSCHGITDYLQNGVTLQNMSRLDFCRQVSGFLSNSTKPAAIKAMLRGWRNNRCRNG